MLCNFKAGSGITIHHHQSDGIHGCDLWITVGRVLTSPLRTRPRAIGPGFVKDAKLSDVRVGVGFW